MEMDNNVPNDSPSNSISLPDRSRPETPNQAHHTVTSNAQQETTTTASASAAVNGRNAAGIPSSSSNPNPSSAARGSNIEDDEDDYTSSSGSSISSSDDEDEDEENADAASETAGDNMNRDNEGITSLPARQKPNIRRMDPQSSILSKLTAFLPQMKSANEDLQKEIAAGRGKELRLDNDEEDEGKVGGDGRYIEMNLGLGVLEEKRPGEEDSTRGEAQGQGSVGDTNLMDQLMGKEKAGSSEKPSIQDLGE